MESKELNDNRDYSSFRDNYQERVLNGAICIDEDRVSSGAICVDLD